jgi:hypothetical protein
MERLHAPNEFFRIRRLRVTVVSGSARHGPPSGSSEASCRCPANGHLGGKIVLHID